MSRVTPNVTPIKNPIIIISDTQEYLNVRHIAFLRSRHVLPLYIIAIRMEESQPIQHENVEDLRIPDEIVQKPPCAWIRVCQGPDCTGLGGGVVFLEIEELVREHVESLDSNAPPPLFVAEAGCRDLCSAGPNVFIHIRNPDKSRRAKNVLAESFSDIKDPAECRRVVKTAIESWTCSSTRDNNAYLSVSRVQAMMARKSERTRWEALREVSRVISKCRKTVATNDGSVDIDAKALHWKEACEQSIQTISNTNTARDERRVERLVQIAWKKLDRICREEFSDDESSGSDESNSDGKSEASSSNDSETEE